METVLQPEPVGSVLPATDELADFDAVMRCYQRAIYGFVLASLRDRDAAEALTRDCGQSGAGSCVEREVEVLAAGMAD